jgi:hypothetical protein
MNSKFNLTTNSNINLTQLDKLIKTNRINLDAEVWGGKGWFFLDSIVLAYPNNPTEKEKQQYKNFFYAIPTVGPCDKCRVHFGQFIEKYPLNDTILQSKDNLILWLLSAHNNVKKINGQKKIKLSEFYEFYNKMYKTDVKLNGCKDKCALTSLPDIYAKTKIHTQSDIQSDEQTHTQSDKQTHTQSDKQTHNFISILFFGIIVALSLYIYRVTQLNMIKK